MRTYAKYCLVFTCWLILGISVWAAAIVHHPFESAGNGAFSNLGQDEFDHQQIADDFQLSTVTTFDSITWFGRYAGAQGVSNPVHFSIRFFHDQGGVPTVSPFAVFNVAVNAQGTGSTFGGLPWFTYTAAFSLTLSPDTYWVSIVESDSQTPAIGPSQWLWGQSSLPGVRAFRLNDGRLWTLHSLADMAFTLSGPGGCDFSSEPDQPERCFGGIGTRCDGLPQPFTSLAPFTRDENSCLVFGWMSVGSILHDRCCLETNNTGVGCANPNGTNRCRKEWNEALANTACTSIGAPRQWQRTFGPYPVGNLGDNLNQDLRAPAGARVNPKHEFLCPSGSCRKGLRGKTIILRDGCGNYCECQ